VASTPIATRNQGARAGELLCFCRSFSLRTELVTTARGSGRISKNPQVARGSSPLLLRQGQLQVAHLTLEWLQG